MYILTNNMRTKHFSLSIINYLNFISNSSHIKLRMNWVIIDLYFQFKCRFIRIWLFPKEDSMLFRIILNMNNIISGECKWLKMTIKLFFITTPWVTIWTNQVTSMTSICIIEVKIGFFYLVYMTYSYSDPWY